MAEFHQVDNKLLDSHDLNEVVIALTPIHHDWFKLGGYLNIPKGTLASISGTYNNDHFRQMSHLISTWISRPTREHLPSWRVLCQALAAMGERDLACKIAGIEEDDQSIAGKTANSVTGGTAVSRVAPTVGDLQEQLYNLTDWELFATHLPEINQHDVSKIFRDYHGVDRQKFELYNVWLNKCAYASWDHVINALEKNRLHRLVADIKQWLKINRGKGGLDERAVAAALAEGKGNLFQSNIILHGPPGAGKSSLKRLILGLDPPTTEEQKSTDIMEKGVRAVSIDKVKEFKIIENEKLIDMLAGEVDNHQKTSKMQPVGIFEQNKEAHLSSYDSFPTMAPLSPLTKTKKPKSIEFITQSLHQQQAVADVPIKIYDTRWHHVVDSGGQPQFLDILPLVYRTPPSLNIVVIRLTDGLDDKQEVRFYEKGENVYTLPDRLALTNREFITNVCQIASSTHGSVKPRVMVVGTRLDDLGESAAEKVNEFNDGLSQVQNNFSDVLICNDREDNIIFPVNTMVNRPERQNYTKKLQKFITKITSKVPPIEVPLRWFVYELEIDKDEGVMSVRDCEQKGELLEMKQNDVKNALTFLNKSALLLYYPDEDLVLTKMDPLIGKLSTLIKASFTLLECDTSGKMKRLRTSGLFTESYLNDILSDNFEDNNEDSFRDRKLSSDKFLKVLEHLKIIVSVGNDEYFLPSALSLEPVNGSSSSLTDKMASPLVFSLGTNRFLPHGFFFTVAIELLSCNDGEYKFQLCSGHGGSNVEQHRREIRIMEADGKIPGVITLTNRIKWIKVVSNNEVKPQMYCPVIYKKVNDAFKRTLDRFHLPAAAVKRSPSTFLCPLCPDCEEEHYCQVTSDKTGITCTRSREKTGHVTKEILHWFGVLGSQSENDISKKPTSTSQQQSQPIQITNLSIHDSNVTMNSPLNKLDQVIQEGQPTLSAASVRPESDSVRQRQIISGSTQNTEFDNQPIFDPKVQPQPMNKEMSSRNNSANQQVNMSIAGNAQVNIDAPLNNQSIDNTGVRSRQPNTPSSNTSSNSATASSIGGKESKESTDGHASVKAFGVEVPKWLFKDSLKWCGNYPKLSCFIIFLIIFIVVFIYFKLYKCT